MRHSKEDRARRHAIKQQQYHDWKKRQLEGRDDLASLTAEEILQRVGTLDESQNKSARIVGVYAEAGASVLGSAPFGVGAEVVVFVGVDRETGKKVVAYYAGATAHAGITLGGANKGAGVFIFTGSPENMAGASVGIQKSAGVTGGSSVSTSGDFLVLSGGNTMLGANLAAGWTWLAETENEEGHLIVAGQEQYKNGRITGEAKHAALSQLVNSKTGRVKVEVKLPQGRTLTRTYTRKVNDDLGLRVTFSDRVTKADGTALTQYDRYPDGASGMLRGFTIDPKTRRMYEPPRPGRRHRNYKDRRQDLLDDAPIPLTPGPEIDHQPLLSGPAHAAPAPSREQIEHAPQPQKEQNTNKNFDMGWAVTKDRSQPHDKFHADPNKPRENPGDAIVTPPLNIWDF